MKKINLIMVITSLIILLQTTISLSEEKIRISNVSFRYMNGKVIINYDLSGPANIDYDVNLVLRRANDSLFRHEPEVKNLTGYVGSGNFAGRDRQIVWDLTKESSKNFTGVDYYFKVNARIAKGGNLFLYLGGGAAVLGGSAAYLLLSKKKDETVIPTTTGFPTPVGRPK